MLTYASIPGLIQKVGCWEEEEPMVTSDSPYGTNIKGLRQLEDLFSVNYVGSHWGSQTGPS